MQSHCMRAMVRLSSRLVNSETWTRHLRSVAGRDNDTAIAEKVGISPSTVGRWRAGTVDPKPRQVVAFARAYGQSPIASLIAAGYLAADDLGDELLTVGGADLDAVSTDALLAELQHRIDSMGELANWVHAIARGEGSPASVAASTFRYASPNRAPSEVRGEDFTDALSEHLETVPGPDGRDLHRVRAPYSPAEGIVTEGRFGGRDVSALDEDELLQLPHAAYRGNDHDEEDEPHAP